MRVRLAHSGLEHEHLPRPLEEFGCEREPGSSRTDDAQIPRFGFWREAVGDRAEIVNHSGGPKSLHQLAHTLVIMGTRGSAHVTLDPPCGAGLHEHDAIRVGKHSGSQQHST